MKEAQFWDRIIFSKEKILCDLQGHSSFEVIEELVGLAVKGENLYDSKEDIIRKFYKREKMGSTALQGGIAMPHLRGDFGDKAIVSVGIHKKGVDFHAIDKKPSHMIMLILMPDELEDFHLKFLSRISRFFFKVDIASDILVLDSEEKVYKLLIDNL